MSRPFDIPLPSLLELTAAQVEVALQNSHAQIERLTACVSSFAKLGAEMSASPDPAVAAQGARVSAEAERALFAMQFHDQLAQRMQHVRDALGDLHDALAAPMPPPTGMLLSVIRARYTMEDERKLFDVMVGAPPDDPDADPRAEREALRGSVELF